MTLATTPHLIRPTPPEVARRKPSHNPSSPSKLRPRERAGYYDKIAKEEEKMSDFDLRERGHLLLYFTTQIPSSTLQIPIFLV